MHFTEGKMNKTKRLLTVVVAVALLVVCISVFAACDKTDSGEKTVVVRFVGNGEYGQTELFNVTATTQTANLHELMIELQKQNKVVYNFSDSSYGAWILSVGYVDGETTKMLEPGGSEYVAILHSINEPDLIDYSNISKSFKLNGKTFMYSYVGISSLPLIDGAEYAFYILSY